MTRVINFSVDGKTDKDILAWLDEQPNKSLAIREAIRAYMAKQEGPTLVDILAEVRSLPSRLSLVAQVPGAAPDDEVGEEPEAAAANLDGLLDRLEDGEL